MLPMQHNTKNNTVEPRRNKKHNLTTYGMPAEEYEHLPRAFLYLSYTVLSQTDAVP